MARCGRKRRLELEAEYWRLLAAGVGSVEACRQLGISRNTVRRALPNDAPPKYQRGERGSIADAAEPQIRELLQKYPEMPATVIAERIGWTRSYAVIKRRVRELRPFYRAAEPVSRTGYEPGELAQCDL